MTNEATVARTLEAWLDYERARRSGETLTDAGFPRTGLHLALETATDDADRWELTIGL